MYTYARSRRISFLIRNFIDFFVEKIECYGLFGRSRFLSHDVDLSGFMLDAEGIMREVN